MFLANENSNKWTCIHLQAGLNREARNTYTLRQQPRTPRIENTHLFLQYIVSLRYIAGSACWGASNTSRPSHTMTCCCSLRLLYKVHAIELNLQSQLHQVVLFSYYSSTEQLFLVEILQPAFHGLAQSRCYPCFHAQQSNTQNVFWEPGDDHNEPPATYETSRSRRLLVSNLLSIVLQSLLLWIFTKISWSTINLKTENGSRLITGYYAFTIRVDQVNFFRENFGVLAWSRISTVIIIIIIGFGLLPGQAVVTLT